MVSPFSFAQAGAFTGVKTLWRWLGLMPLKMPNAFPP